MPEQDQQNNLTQPESTTNSGLPRNQIIFLRSLFFLVLVLVVLTAYLAQHNYVMTTSYRVQEIEKKLKFLKNENDRLQIAVAKSVSLENIDDLAATKLKMIRPERVVYIRPGQERNK